MQRTFPILLLAAACTPSRAGIPLPAGSTAITTSIGGPLIRAFGPTMPLPLTSVGVVNVYASAPEPKPLWRPEGIPHDSLADAAPDAFAERILSFYGRS